MVADLVALDRRADFDDGAGGFMAHDEVGFGRLVATEYVEFAEGEGLLEPCYEGR